MLSNALDAESFLPVCLVVRPPWRSAPGKIVSGRFDGPLILATIEAGHSLLLTMFPVSCPEITIAIVEDEPVLREEMAFQLTQLGFVVQTFENAPQFYRFLAVNPRTIAVLDIGLDAEDGLSICQHIRRHNPQIGIVFVSARGLRDDRLIGLAAGADAYLVKPADIDELALILKRLAERQRVVAPDSRALASLSDTAWQLVDGGAFLTAPNGVRIRLAINESQLLRVLTARIASVCTHAELGIALSLHPDEVDKHRIEVILSRLRSKILRLTGLPPPLRSSRGVGYCWDACVEPV